MQSYSQVICLCSVKDNIQTSADNLNKDLKRINNRRSRRTCSIKKVFLKIMLIPNATIDYISSSERFEEPLF